MAALRRYRAPPRPGDGGFTVIEALVALVLLGVALGVLQAGVTGGSQKNARAERELEALEMARSHLAEAGVAAPLQDGLAASGDNGIFSWRLTEAKRPQALPAGEGAEGYWVTADVSWEEPQGRGPAHVRLTTLKLKRLDEVPR